MKFAAALLIAFASSATLASDPGQPLDCSDMVFLVPGIACARFGPPGDGSAQVRFGSSSTFDNEGRFFRLTPSRSIVVGTCGSQPLYRTALQWMDGNAWNTLAYVDDRCLSPGPPTAFKDSIYPGGAALDAAGGNASLTFDPVGGRLVVNLVSSCDANDCSAYPAGSGDFWLASISGFATMFDVLQTFTPPPTLGFRVPYMPEGMPAADHFDTYWGPLTKPIDFTQAHPLQCGYPAAPPHVGNYLTVADTVPTPAPGQGVYYVTAASYQGATRYGRKAMGGHLSGRYPAVLPGCVP